MCNRDAEDIIPPMTIQPQDRLAFTMGVISRDLERAFLSNPYTKDTAEWHAWREGWLAHMNRDAMR